jgi:DNA-binding NtrC family response regulator
MACGMARLLHDRYFEYRPSRTWDLATGDDVAAADAAPPASAPDASLATFAEVLEHGADGTPRAIGVDVPRSGTAAAVIAAAAEESRRHGYVPIAVEVYLRLRATLADELRDRALVLIARPQVPARASRTALVDAASRSNRPHVLMTLRSARRPAPPGAGLVREARAAYGGHPTRAPAMPEDVVRQLQRAARADDFVREGRHASAERLLRDVIGALVRRQAGAAASAMYVRLGRLLLERGRAGAADTAFGEAATQAEGAGDEALVAMCRTWQAAARTDAARLTAAESLCRAVLIAAALHPDERARAEATLGRILLWQGRHDEARHLGFVDLRVATGSDPFVHATAVRVLLEVGDLFAAGQRARDLLTATSASGDALARVMALGAHVRVLLTTGDLSLAAERVDELRTAARLARSPLRFARISLLLVDAWRRAGRDRNATTTLRTLDKLRSAAPPLLRDAIEQRLRGRVQPNSVALPVAAAAPLATSLLAIAQREQSDRQALVRLSERSADALRSSRIDLCSADAGPVTTILSTGNGLVTHLGARVLEAGIAIGPEPGDPGREIGVPVRLGDRLLAAIVARWPVDAWPRPDAAEILQLAAAVAAPRIDSFLSAARAQARMATAIPELIGASGIMDDVRSHVVRAATSPFSVLIDGESGVGKELVARAIHQLSARRERSFCDVNCAALPDDLLESELFGHAKGAFTGAITERAGLIEEADGGTLFLDEVLDLSLRAQAKLLRVVQQQEVRRVGETFSRKVDVRFVSAANRDVRAEAAAGRFRQDLLYRLDVIRIHLPPLRERPADIPLLAEHFWRTASARVGSTATLGHGVLAALTRYHWPGNVRELQNVVAALAVAAPARGQVRPSQLPAVVTGATAVTSGRLAEARAQFERRFLDMALARAGGSRSQAAREIGLSRQGLLKLMTRLGMQNREEPA